MVSAETFHNKSGDHADGDGVLVYPGISVSSGNRSVGMEGVIPSFRLKQWRRGISDAGYLQLARAMGPSARKQADDIAAALIPQALAGADGPKAGAPASWPQSGAAYFRARQELFDIISRGAGN